MQQDRPQLIGELERIAHTPLDMIGAEQVESVLGDVFDRKQNEEQVYVARFGSVI